MLQKHVSQDEITVRMKLHNFILNIERFKLLEIQNRVQNVVGDLSFPIAVAYKLVAYQKQTCSNN